MPVPDPQPAKAVMAARRISVRGLARHLDVSAGWVGRVLNGWEQPSAEFRRRVVDLLGQPEDELFRPRQPAEQYPGDGQIGRSA